MFCYIMISKDSCQLPYNCNFEEDWCGMEKYEKYEYFDRISKVIDTPIRPIQAKNGRFYILSEGHTEKRLQKSYLSTSRLDHSGPVCIEFHYKIHDINQERINSKSRMSTLKVFTTAFGENTPVFFKRGNNDQSWQKAVVAISINNNEKVVFMGNHASGVKSYIAIDQLTISPEECRDKEADNLPFSCGFESEDLCDMVQDETDQFDWARLVGDTQTLGTGPMKAQSGKYYIFMEASAPQQRGNKAYIRTPSLNHNGATCVHFFYHMHSAAANEIGTFKVFKASRGEEYTIFSNKEDMGENWKEFRLTVDIKNGDKIVFMGEVGTGVTGDIGIDDIHIISGQCTDQPVTKTPKTGLPVELPFLCDFEQADLCNMQQSSQDQFDWTRQSGRTETQGTGPDSAYSGNYYIFTEASEPRRYGDKAVIMTPPLMYSGQICVRFVFHIMGGAEIGKLQVYLSNRGEDNHFFQQIRSQGNQWNSAEQTVFVSYGEKVVFVGVIGGVVFSDIALDRLDITAGQCDLQKTTTTTTLISQISKGRLPFDCDFETENLCDMTQSRSDDKDWDWQSGPTSTQETGPSSANTGRFYIYLESSYPVKINDSAVIETPNLEYQGDICVRFYYHMQGREQIGTLNVYNSLRTEETPVFKKAGHMGSNWNFAEVTMSVVYGEKVVFSARKGSGIYSDIAIDSLKITGGSCDSTKVKPVLPGLGLRTLPYECDFEDEKICGIFQSTEDAFDWTRQSGGTKTENTGPGSAYSGSYYLYIEASEPRKYRDKAIFQTPGLQHTGNICIDFYLHMRSRSEMGTLRVYTSMKGEGQSFFTRFGHVKDDWTRARETVSIVYGEKIVFDGTVGSSVFGDISIDKLRVTSGTCSDGERNTTTAAILPFSCSFEKEDLCGMNLLQSDQFDWTRRTGSTESENTGPNKAFSGLAYAYIEGSEPRKSGDKAIMQSPQLKMNGFICVLFYYHMFGTGIGNLKVYMSSKGENNHMFNKSGDQGNEWKKASITAPVQYVDKVMFVGVRGSDHRSDIALDKVDISAGKCGADHQKPVVEEGQTHLPFSCSFEQGICSMVQKNENNFNWQIKSGPTETSGTGPTGAKEGRFYLYAEASVPRKLGDRTVIKTPEILHSGDVCVRFHYHMFDESDSGMGNLTVKLGSRSLPVFEQSGNQGSEWKQANINVRINYADQVEIIATRGGKVLGDIAIDMLVIEDHNCEGRQHTTTHRTPGVLPPQYDLFSEYSCDMERDGRTDRTCKLRQESSTTLQWYRGNGYTPSGRKIKMLGGVRQAATGPVRAHQGLYYAYLEASGAAKGQTARLILEGSDSKRTGDNCLRFYYSLNGHHIGSLSVYMKKSGLRVTLWMMKGHQSTDWKQAVVEVNMDSLSQIGIEATASGGYSGDIAIDDVTISPGRCQSIPKEYVFMCTFETVNSAATLCGIQQETTDTTGNDWILWANNTPSDFTGPDKAYSGEYYIFMEASKPREPGDQARILLPILRVTGTVCIEFYFFMYGHHMGSLEVYTELGETRKTRDTIEGQQGKQWLRKQLTISDLSYNSQLGLRAIRGSEFSGDIAVDNVTVKLGECRT